jgi:predicted GH43/DUF377 family glycosyl hydrolase
MHEHDFALAVHAFYARELDCGRRACERLLSTPLPPEVEMQTRSNRLWYAQTLDELVEARFHRIDIEPAHEGWSTFNPTILAHGDELLCIVRSSNYRIIDGRYEMPPADAGVIRTENLLVRYRPDLSIRDCRPISGPGYPTTDYPVDGLEDCRLRHTQTGIGVSATVRNAAPFDGSCRIATADLDIDSATFRNLFVLSSLSCQEHEKNWMPIEGRGGWVYAVSHAGHTVTVDADPTLAGAWLMHQRSPAAHIAKDFRGGGQVVPFGEGYLAVIHEVAFSGDQRAYEHRLAWFDNALALRRISQPFAFRETRAIEFAAGLAVLGDRVVVSFGVRDAEAWLVEVPSENIEALLYEIPISGQDR